MQVHKYASIRVRKHVSWKVYKYASVKVWMHANMQEYKYGRLKVCKFQSMQICNDVIRWACQHTSITL